MTLKIKVNHQGYLIKNGISEMLDIDNVRIDTKIESKDSIEPEISKVICKKCLTLSLAVQRLRYVNYFNICDIPGLEVVRLDTKIMSV